MRSLISRAGHSRHRSAYRVLLLVLLAFCSFGIEDIESDWGPAPADSTRSSNRHRRGRITRATTVSPHVFRSIGGADSGSGPAAIDVTPVEPHGAALAERGLIDSPAAGHPLAAFIQTLTNRGPPAFNR